MVELHTLPPGARFALEGGRRTGTLIYANDCRARIRYDGDARTVEVHTEDGGTREFEAPGKALDISPRTMVTEIQS